LTKLDQLIKAPQLLKLKSRWTDDWEIAEVVELMEFLEEWEK